MHLIEVTPAPCSVCGRGNAANAYGEKTLFVDFERDVNWNDPLVMCEDCIAQAGGMVGLSNKELIEAVRVEVKERDKTIHALRAEMDSMQKRARRLGIAFEKEPVA